MGARETALLALERCRRDNSWSDALLSGLISSDGLDRRDAALATRLCYGALQNMILCDYCIDSFSKIKTKKMQPKLLDIMRISVYQLLFMDKIPERAAVNEGVALAKKYGFPNASGMVNAVLRRVSENREQLMAVGGESGEKYLSIRYSHPLWLVMELVSAFGYDEAERFLAANNADTPVTLQVNTLKTDAEALTELLGASAHPWLPDAVEVENMSAVIEKNALEKGLCYVQDAAAKMAAIAAMPARGMRVLDACSAPGGKSFAAAILSGGEAEITACDIHEKKLERILKGAKVLEISSITTKVMDARTPDESMASAYDIVLADVPCSGLGVIRKKPDIRYKSAEDIARLPEIQKEIINGISACVKPGGVLIYSTCTVLKRENEDVISEFLSNHADFASEEFELPRQAGRSENGMITLLPHIHGTDGFFICKLRRS